MLFPHICVCGIMMKNLSLTMDHGKKKFRIAVSGGIGVNLFLLYSFDSRSLNNVSFNVVWL